MIKLNLLKFDLEDLRSPVWYGLPEGKYSAENVIPINRDQIFYAILTYQTFIYDPCKWGIRVRIQEDLLRIYLKEIDREQIISELDSIFSGMVRYVNTLTNPVYMNAERITAVKCDSPCPGDLKFYFDEPVKSFSYDLAVWGNDRQSHLVLNQLKDLHFNKYL